MGDRADETGRALTSREVLVPSRGHLRTSAFVKESVLGKVLGHAALGEPLGICALMRRYCWPVGDVANASASSFRRSKVMGERLSMLAVTQSHACVKGGET